MSYEITVSMTLTSCNPEGQELIVIILLTNMGIGCQINERFLQKIQEHSHVYMFISEHEDGIIVDLESHS